VLLDDRTDDAESEELALENSWDVDEVSVGDEDAECDRFRPADDEDDDARRPRAALDEPRLG
jgi:hypothetical protein